MGCQSPNLQYLRTPYVLSISLPNSRMSTFKTFRKSYFYTNNVIIPCAHICSAEILQPLLIKKDYVGGGRIIGSPAGAGGSVVVSYSPISRSFFRRRNIRVLTRWFLFAGEGVREGQPQAISWDVEHSPPCGAGRQFSFFSMEMGKHTPGCNLCKYLGLH